MTLGAQVAHFLEADVQPWAAALAGALFPETLVVPVAPAAAEARPLTQAQASPLSSEPQADDAPACSSAEGLQDAWRRLDDLAPLGGAVDAVLRAWQRNLHEQLPLTPPEWHPELLRSHVTAGELELSCTAAALGCDAMHAVRDVHTATLLLIRGIFAGYDAEETVERLCSALAALRALRSLTFVGRPDPGSVQLLAPALSQLSQLADFDFRLNNERISAVETALLIASLGCLTSLTSLRFKASDLDDSGVRALAAALSRLSQLAQLGMPDNQIGRCDAAPLASALARLPELTFLDLSTNALRDSGVELAQALSRLPQLAHLALDGKNSDFSTSDAAELAAPLGLLTVLTFLSLVSVHGAARLLAPALGRLSRLAHLDLRTGSDHETELTALAPPIARLTALTTLRVIASGFGAVCVAALAPALARLSQLAQFVLGCNDLGSGSAAALAPPLGHLASLTSLMFVGFRHDDCLDGLVLALRRLPRLAQLTIDVGGVSEDVPAGDGAAALPAHLGHLTALTQLNLQRVRIRDAAPSSLAQALGALSRLQHLCLSSISLGDESVPHLAAALARLTGLRSVRLASNCFSEAGKAQLRATVPARVSAVLVTSERAPGRLSDGDAAADS